GGVARHELAARATAAGRMRQRRLKTIAWNLRHPVLTLVLWHGQDLCQRGGYGVPRGVNFHCSLSRGVPMSLRPVKRVIEAQPTMEGAGVKLRRAFGFGNTGEFDPFLLLDDFRNDRPADYLAG